MSWGIFKSALRIIMQFTPENIDLASLVNDIEIFDGIKNVHHVHIWQINEHDIMFECHIDLQKDIKITEFEKILKKIRKVLAQYNIEHITIQPEYSLNDKKQIIINN
ncbi:MAG: hypothetical protein Kow0068_20590 [Marinilabiliales bacterium]